MMKFILVSRRPDGGSLERMFYEWAVFHVALMLTTPAVPRVFKRYAQHYGIRDLPDQFLLHPRSPEGWETMADHWVETYDDLVLSVTDPDYVVRMQPHRFSSSNFIIMLGHGHTVFERDDFHAGGVKVVQFHRRKSGLSREGFEERFRTAYGPALVEALKDAGLRKYEQNVPAPLDPATFKGTLFERGSVGLHGGMDEIWLDDLEALRRLAAVPGALAELRAIEAELFEPGASFSMTMLERLAFDFVTRDRTPLPAVLTPGSLEASLVTQEKIYQEALRRQK